MLAEHKEVKNNSVFLRMTVCDAEVCDNTENELQGFVYLSLCCVYYDNGIAPSLCICKPHSS